MSLFDSIAKKVGSIFIYCKNSEIHKALNVQGFLQQTLTVCTSSAFKHLLVDANDEVQPQTQCTSAFRAFSHHSHFSSQWIGL